MSLWSELIENVREELEDREQEIVGHNYPEDLLHEIVDSFIPIYNSDILEFAQDNPPVCYPEDEGLYSNDMDIFKRLQTGIYERILPVAYEVFEEIMRTKN